MLERIRNAASAMTAIVRRQEITANNLANVNTVGFRKDRIFETILTERIEDDGSPSATRQLDRWVDSSQGQFEFSGRPLDVAISGDGFFQIADQTTGKSYYTRAGQFETDDTGQLVDPGGRVVQGTSGPITIPPDATDVSVTKSGEVISGSRVFGKLSVVTFENPETLERLDGSTFDANDALATQVETIEIRSGYVEQSNVNVMTEMADMIQNSRIFETQQRALKTIDQTLERAIRDLGKY